MDKFELGEFFFRKSDWGACSFMNKLSKLDSREHNPNRATELLFFTIHAFNSGWFERDNITNVQNLISSQFLKGAEVNKALHIKGGDVLNLIPYLILSSKKTNVSDTIKMIRFLTEKNADKEVSFEAVNSNEKKSSLYFLIKEDEREVEEIKVLLDYLKQENFSIQVAREQNDKKYSLIHQIITKESFSFEKKLALIDWFLNNFGKEANWSVKHENSELTETLMKSLKNSNFSSEQFRQIFDLLKSNGIDINVLQKNDKNSKA
jgi:hypothetical protein